MEALKAKLESLIDELSQESRAKLKDRLDNLVSVYPFNEYEFMISALLGLDKISLDDYFEIRDEYLARNMYLYIFEIESPPVLIAHRIPVLRATRHNISP